MKRLVIDSVVVELREESWSDCLRWSLGFIYVFVIKMIMVDSESQTTVSMCS